MLAQCLVYLPLQSDEAAGVGSSIRGVGGG